MNITNQTGAYQNAVIFLESVLPPFYIITPDEGGANFIIRVSRMTGEGTTIYEGLSLKEDGELADMLNIYAGKLLDFEGDRKHV